MTEFEFVGQVEVININLGKKLKPGDIVKVEDKKLIERLEADALFKKVEAKPKVKPKKEGE